MAARFASEGRKPYLIPGGGSNPTGALGYVNAAMELIVQANDMGLRIDHVVSRDGQRGNAGRSDRRPLRHTLRRAAAWHRRSRPPRTAGRERLQTCLRDREKIGDRRARCDAKTSSRIATMSARDTGSRRRTSLDAIRLLARTEGILLDPVYTGKGMAGLIDLINRGHFKKGQAVVFLHTGGSVGLFGYLDDFGLPAGGGNH